MQWKALLPPPPASNAEKGNSQNGLRMYPDIFPHYKQSILSYAEPPNSHMAKLFVLFSVISPITFLTLIP